jgi:hypothetical protein
MAPLALALTVSAASWAACPDPKPAGCQDYTQRPVPPGSLDGVSGLRRAIIDAAASQIGQVSELGTDDGTKCGWGNLQSFYETSYGRNLRDSELTKLKRPLTITPVTDPDHPDPQDPDHYVYVTDPKHPDLDDPLHFMQPKRIKVDVDHGKINEWCGIFALWATKTGANASSDPSDADAVSKIQATFWRSRGKDGWGVDGLELKPGYAGIQPGDIAYFRGNLQHQAIVERVLNGRIYTIDGNQECQQVGRVDRDIREVAGYYRVQEPVEAPPVQGQDQEDPDAGELTPAPAPQE